MIEITRLPVGELREWENNARIHTKRNIDALKESLKEFGQTKPIVVQKSSMRIIAGNGTYAALIALGWDSVDCHVVDISDSKAEALAIADNRTGLLSQWDEKNLTDALTRIQECGELHLTGFDELELDKMISFQNGDMFDSIKPKEEKKKEKPKESDFPSSDEVPPPTKASDDVEPPATATYDEQISFTICGFVFSLSNMNEIRELRELIGFLKDSPKNEREEMNSLVFEAIEKLLTEKFMR